MHKSLNDQLLEIVQRSLRDHRLLDHQDNPYADDFTQDLSALEERVDDVEHKQEVINLAMQLIQELLSHTSQNDLIELANAVSNGYFDQLSSFIASLIVIQGDIIRLRSCCLSTRYKVGLVDRRSRGCLLRR